LTWALGCAFLVLLSGGHVGFHPSTVAAAAPVKIGALTEAWGPNPQVVGVRDGLRELGYRDDVDFVIGVRFTQGDVSILSSAARDLVEQGADILFTGAGMATEAAQAATHRIPIVFAGGDSPVERGLVQSIAHPGGNITGVVDLGNELAGKRLEYFREIVPALKRVLVAYAANSPWGTVEVQAYVDAARRLRITLVEKPLRDQAEARAAFAAVRRGQVQGLLVSHSLTWNVPGLAIETGNRLGMPNMFPASFFVHQGGLASYGPDYYATGRQAARLVDKIIRGVKPGEIPVESNARIELTINLKTAKALGLTIPESVLIRADEVIR
jgi:putative ABC transport system substrate-binding protein